MTVVYVDLLLVINVLANYLLLLGTGRIVGLPLQRWRILAGAVLGGVYSVCVFLPGCGWLGQLPCKVGSGVLMLLCGFGGSPRLLRAVVVFFMASAALAGLILGAELLGQSTALTRNGVFYSTVDFRLLLLLFAVCYFVLSLFFRRAGAHGSRELVAVEVVLFGKTVSLTALRDTGHTVTDPVTNRTVLVVDHTVLRRVLPVLYDPQDPIGFVKRCHASGINGVRLIPYRTVGENCGMLAALKADRITAMGKDLDGLMVALAPNSVDDGCGYQALIGGF